MTDAPPARPGALVVIGGHEEKEGRRPILREVARRVGAGRLVIATVASRRREGYFDAYRAAFADLGVEDTAELYVEYREEALAPEGLGVFEGATGVFFTGGDQKRLAGLLGGTPIEARAKAILRAGGVLAGTSAGASAMSETMIARGPGDESSRLGELDMAPGLGFLPGVVVDQHFAERGRLGRLLGAVAQNPRELGLGLDENTAVVVEEGRFRVLGEGAVYVLDGTGITRSNVAEGRAERALSVRDLRLHVLADGDAFDLGSRRPLDEKGSAY